MKIYFIVLASILFMINHNTNAQEIEKVNKVDNEYIYSNSIKLFIGDSIYVKAKLKENKLVQFSLVDNINDSTIIIGFRYGKFGMRNASFLTVKHPYSKEMIYEAKLRIDPLVSYSTTSIMPVFPNLPGIEVWNYKLESIILYNFKLK